MTRILVAEDETRIASFLEKGLRANGFEPTLVRTGDEALELARTGLFDLLVLDIGLPALDGFEVLRELRHDELELPVVILTARDSLRDTVAGLDMGADDYVTKPFTFEELLARIRARLREERRPEPKALRSGNAELDLRTRRLAVDGRDLDLTAREFGIAEMFFRHPGQVLSRQQLLDAVWGFDEPESNVVDVYVGYLRRKLGKDRISAVRGLGYRFEG